MIYRRRLSCWWWFVAGVLLLLQYQSCALLPPFLPHDAAPATGTVPLLAAGMDNLRFTSAELWGVRMASAITTYFGFVAFSDRPRGSLSLDPSSLAIRPSQVPGAGNGLYVTQTLPKGTILGTYPGVVVPLQQNLKKLQDYPLCEGYIWRFSDNQFVIDPTDSEGVCQDFCIGGNPSMPLSQALFSVLPFFRVPTTLCRINEPPKGLDVNVVTDEDRSSRTVTFSLERDVYEGEELFIDYGLYYDRSRYSG